MKEYNYTDGVLQVGDCMDAFKGMKDKGAALTLTDIPYGEVNRKSNGLRKLDKEAADVLTFDIPEFVRQCARVTSGSVYIFCGTEQVSVIRSTMVDLGMSTRLGIWKKTNPSPMNGQYIWLSGVEACVFGKWPKATFNEHCKSPVWEFPSGRSKIHPTEKPLKLFRYLIQVSSNEGDWVFDPCAGSGTTGLAARELKRKFHLVELKPEYAEMAKARLV